MVYRSLSFSIYLAFSSRFFWAPLRRCRRHRPRHRPLSASGNRRRVSRFPWARSHACFYSRLHCLSSLPSRGGGGGPCRRTPPLLCHHVPFPLCYSGDPSKTLASAPFTAPTQPAMPEISQLFGRLHSQLTVCLASGIADDETGRSPPFLWVLLDAPVALDCSDARLHPAATAAASVPVAAPTQAAAGDRALVAIDTDY